MQEERSALVPYASYLLRIWREEKTSSVEWRSQVDHIQSGRRISFDTLDNLLDFLRQQAEDLPASRTPSNE